MPKIRWQWQVWKYKGSVLSVNPQTNNNNNDLKKLLNNLWPNRLSELYSYVSNHTRILLNISSFIIHKQGHVPTTLFNNYQCFYTVAYIWSWAENYISTRKILPVDKLPQLRMLFSSSLAENLKRTKALYPSLFLRNSNFYFLRILPSLSFYQLMLQASKLLTQFVIVKTLVDSWQLQWLNTLDNFNN